MPGGTISLVGDPAKTKDRAVVVSKEEKKRHNRASCVSAELKASAKVNMVCDARRKWEFPTTDPVALGLESWEQFRTLMMKKIQCWNAMHPEMIITADNVSLDHIKPCSEFKHIDDMHMCQHYTNLQPLPKIVNQLKADTWHCEDEHFWRANIYKCRDFAYVYLPRKMKVCRLSDSA